MTPQSIKKKGQRLAKLVRETVLSTFPILHEGDVRVTPSGVNGADLMLSRKAKDLFPFSVEAKTRQSIVIYDWWAQTNRNTEEGTDPLLVVKADHKEPLVIMDVRTFTRIIRNQR